MQVSAGALRFIHIGILRYLFSPGTYTAFFGVLIGSNKCAIKWLYLFGFLETKIRGLGE
jgi:hypothetical protein